MASPMRAYLRAHAGQLQEAAFFAVMGGHGAQATVQEMKFACAAPEASTCVFTQHDVESGQFRQLCADFTRALHSQLALPTRVAGIPPAA
jgi:hypothetical protein